MKFRLLGTMEVEGPSGLIALRGTKRRAIVIRLAVNPNLQVSADALLHDVWFESASGADPSTLTSHISNVRKLLGASCIEQGAGGYRLIVDPGELDTSVFEAELDLGQQALHVQELATGLAHFERALALWRGPALADVRDAPWARGEVARLEELRLATEERVLEVRLRLGQHHDLIAEAEKAVESEPLREQRWAMLMLALYRSGRQADALRSYQRLRRHLDELGVEPSPPVSDLEQAIILQSPELRWCSPSPASSEGDLIRRTPERALAPAPRPRIIEELAVPRATFVGRTRELDQLERARSDPRERRAVIMVGGEPGVGKSALAATFAQSVLGKGGDVLVGRCFEDSGIPYQPFVEALGRYVERADPELLERYVDEHGGDLSRLLPTFARRFPKAGPHSSSDADTERYLMFAAATSLLESADQNRPLLFVLEDLHWADPSTLQLFRHLIAYVRHPALTVLGTFRSNEVVTESPLGSLLAECRRDPDATRLELNGLAQSEVQELCVAFGPSEVDQATLFEVSRGLTEETDGNPLFVTEVLRHWAELTTSDLHPVSAPDQVPPSLQEVIGHRVAALGAKSARILTLGSVIGVEFDLQTLGAVADVEQDDLLDIAEHAVKSALVRTGSGHEMRFAHALVQKTLYQGLLPARRRQLHGKVAHVLEAQAESPSIVARHYLAAGEQEPALRWLERAGYEAAARVAPDEAVQCFETACRLVERLHPDEVLRRCDLLVQLGTALFLTGQSNFREVLLEAGALAEKAGDGRRMAEVALANTRGWYSVAGRTDYERVGALQEALDALGEGDGELRARLTAAICSEATFGTPLAERRSLANRARSEARALGDARTIVDVHNLVIEALRFPTELPQRLEDTAVALHHADECQDPAALFWAVSHRMRTLMESGRVDEATSQFDRMVAISDQVGQPVMRWMTTFSRAQWFFLHGNTDEGERLTEEAFALGESSGQPDALNYYATQLVHARWQQGRLEEVIPFIEQSASDNPGIPGYRSALARALCQAGDVSAAARLLEDALVDRFAHLPQDLLWTYGMVFFAEVAIRIEHADAAAALYEHLAPFAGQVAFLGTTCEGPISHYLGGLATVLGRFDEAREHFDTALVFAQSADSPYFQARIAIEAGWLAHRSGDTSVARHLVMNGRSMAQQASFVGEMQRADKILSALPH